MQRNLKVALVHEWFTDITGSEKVLEAIYKLFPGPIYTLIKNNSSVKQTIFSHAKIYTSFLQNIPKIEKFYRNFLFLFPLAIEQFDLSDYDLIISSSHSVAKGVLVNPDQIHICYCHTPMRYAWFLSREYIKNLNIITLLIAKPIFHYLRMWDVVSANRVDYFIANSRNVAKRIKKTYKRDASVIYPPVDIEKFEVSSEKEDFFVTVSRLVPYKRVDLIVEAFSKLEDKKLVVIGDGPDLKVLKKKASDNIIFLGRVSFEALRKYLRKAKAFIFAAEEDFGISLVEAQACGTPVIAFGKGGAEEIVVNEETGVLFFDQNPEAIIDALKHFEKIRFDPFRLRKNAERFKRERFEQEFNEFVRNVTTC